jgi:thiol:disulfide interchange protein DsbG
MSPYAFLTALCLGVTALAATACSYADNGDRPPVLDALEASGLGIVEEFPADDGLRGFAAVAGQQPIAVYVTPGGDAIVGTRVDRNGNEPDAIRLQDLVAAPMGERMLSQLEAAEWVLDGSADAPRVIYTFTDPNCPFCNRLWHAARPWVEEGKVQLRHVMVGVIREDSAGKVATILGSGDPGARLAENERRFAQGGVPAASVVPASVRRALESNHLLMMELGFRGTPALVFRDTDGTVQRRGGMPQGDDLNEVMGPR